ncbi:MAG: peptidylprolyl isomerase [Gemmataceae bacterium]
MSKFSLAKKLHSLFGKSHLASNRSTFDRRSRLELMVLEDRTVPTANATGTILGKAFVDLNRNGIFDAGEKGLQGMTIGLTGTYAKGPIASVVQTDAAGNYRFENVPIGNYRLTQLNPLGMLIGGPLSLGPVSVAGGQSKQVNFTYRGVTANFVSLRLFFNNSDANNLQLGPAGSGVAKVLYRENSRPTVANTIANVNAFRNGADTIIDLAGKFTDADLTNSQIRFVTNQGNINVELYDKDAPQTVANYFNYIKNDRYDNTVFHRHASNFVLQGGGFKFTENPPTGSTLTNVATYPTIQNEFSATRPNVKGTIAMAKLGGDPNSASNQFFFNLTDNTTTLGPTNNGGFTVFGKVVSDSDQATINKFTSFPYSRADKSSVNSAWNEIPLKGNPADPFPGTTKGDNFALIKDVKVIKRDEALSYQVLSNSNSNLVTATIENNRLRLKYAPGATGTAQISVQATDRFGAKVNTSFTVNVQNRAPSATVVFDKADPKTNDILKANVTRTDPDGDPVKLTYVWKVNGVAVKTTSNTSTTNDTLDLGQVYNSTINPGKGDVITVEVTPNDGLLDGTLATATATIANSAPVITAINFNNLNPGFADLLTGSVVATDADGDALTFSYDWLLNNNPPSLRQLSGTSSTSDSLNLSGVANLAVGDLIFLTARASDGIDVSNPFSNSVAVQGQDN